MSFLWRVLGLGSWGVSCMKPGWLRVCPSQAHRNITYRAKLATMFRVLGFRDGKRDVEMTAAHSARLETNLEMPFCLDIRRVKTSNLERTSRKCQWSLFPNRLSKQESDRDGGLNGKPVGRLVNGLHKEGIHHSLLLQPDVFVTRASCASAKLYTPPELDRSCEIHVPYMPRLNPGPSTLRWRWWSWPSSTPPYLVATTQMRTFRDQDIERV